MAEAIISRRGNKNSTPTNPTFKTITITENTNWTVPYAVNNTFSVLVYGGGGGSGATIVNFSRGYHSQYAGGGGGWMNNTVVELERGSSVQITIGAGGINANSGGSTSFGSYIAANGGSRGFSSVQYRNSNVSGRFLYHPQTIVGGNGGSGGGGGLYQSGMGGGNGGNGYQFGGGGGSHQGGQHGYYGGGGGTSTVYLNGRIYQFRDGSLYLNNPLNDPETYSSWGGQPIGIDTDNPIESLGGNGANYYSNAQNGTDTRYNENIPDTLRGAGLAGYSYKYTRLNIIGAGGGGGFGGNGGGASSSMAWINTGMANSFGYSGGSSLWEINNIIYFGAGGGGGYGSNGGHAGYNGSLRLASFGGGGGYGGDGGNGTIVNISNHKYICAGGGGGYGKGGEANSSAGFGGGAAYNPTSKLGIGGSGICIIQYYG